MNVTKEAKIGYDATDGDQCPYTIGTPSSDAWFVGRKCAELGLSLRAIYDPAYPIEVRQLWQDVYCRKAVSASIRAEGVIWFVMRRDPFGEPVVEVL